MHLLVSFVSLSPVRDAAMSSKGGGFDTVQDERVWSWSKSLSDQQGFSKNFFCHSIATSGGGAGLLWAAKWLKNKETNI